MHFSFSNRFNDFPDIREVTTKIEKIFLVRGRGPISLIFLRYTAFVLSDL